MSLLLKLKFKCFFFFFSNFQGQIEEGVGREGNIGQRRVQKHEYFEKKRVQLFFWTSEQNFISFVAYWAGNEEPPGTWVDIRMYCIFSSQEICTSGKRPNGVTQWAL